MRRYETPNPKDCTVSNGAKQYIDGHMDTVSHINWTIEAAKRRGAPQSVIDRLEEMRDLNLDIVAAVCLLEKAQNGSKMEQAITDATQDAVNRHLMEHITGVEDLNSPARLDPAEAAEEPRDGRRGRPFTPDDEDVV
jgi:hypothetical protein